MSESGEVDGIVAEEACKEEAAVCAGEAVVSHVCQGDAGEECEEACLFRCEDVAVQGGVDYRNAGTHIKTVVFFIAGKVGCDTGYVEETYEKPDVEVRQSFLHVVECPDSRYDKFPGCGIW